MANAGCKVILLLDVVHKDLDEAEGAALTSWVRDLRDHQNVITILASRSGPSEPRIVNGRGNFPRFRHRIIAQGVLNSPDARWQTRGRIDAKGHYSLHGFQAAVRDIVREHTQGSQDAACYIPELIPERFPLLDPH